MFLGRDRTPAAGRYSNHRLPGHPPQPRSDARAVNQQDVEPTWAMGTELKRLLDIARVAKAR